MDLEEDFQTNVLMLVVLRFSKTYMLEELAQIVLQVKQLEKRRMRKGMKKFAKEK